MRKKTLFAVPLIAGGLIANPLLAANDANSNAGPIATQPGTTSDSERSDAEQQIREAMRLVEKMKSSPEARGMLERAKGVFLVPDYARAAIGVGGSGGAGVLLVRQGDRWSNPLFYNMGAVSFGPQVGASAGELALVLMNDKAVQTFRQSNKFSLDAKAGLTIVNWSARDEGAWGRGDIVLWSDTEGAYAGATIAVSDINFDEKQSRAYYGVQVTPNAPGQPDKAPQDAKQLKQALASAR